MKKIRSKPDKPGSQHEFSKLPAFDAAMQKLVAVPKKSVEKAEKQARTPRSGRR